MSNFQAKHGSNNYLTYNNWCDSILMPKSHYENCIKFCHNTLFYVKKKIINGIWISSSNFHPNLAETTIWLIIIEVTSSLGQNRMMKIPSNCVISLFLRENIKNDVWILPPNFQAKPASNNHLTENNWCDSILRPKSHNENSIKLHHNTSFLREKIKNFNWISSSNFQAKPRSNNHLT